MKVSTKVNMVLLTESKNMSLVSLFSHEYEPLFEQANEDVRNTDYNKLVKDLV